MYSPSKNVIISVLTRIHRTRYWSCMERGLLGELDCKFDKYPNISNLLKDTSKMCRYLYTPILTQQDGRQTIDKSCTSVLCDLA